MRGKSSNEGNRNSWEGDWADSYGEEDSAPPNFYSNIDLSQEQNTTKRRTNPSASLLFSEIEQSTESDAAFERMREKKPLIEMVGLNTEFCRTRHTMRANKLQRFFGLNNSEAWQAKAKELRENAEKKLFAHLEKMGDEKNKYELLLTALNLPLFKDHRHNYFFTGAFGRTGTYIRLETKLKNIEEYLSISDSTEELTDTAQQPLKGYIDKLR